MNASPPPSDAEREREALRRRAHSRHPDVPDDPAEQARLTEPEGARTADSPAGADAGTRDAPAAAGGASIADSTRTESGAGRPDTAGDIATPEGSGEDAPRSLWHRLTATRRRSALVAGALVAGALVAIPAIANTVASLVGPHPDVTLSPVADEADALERSLLAYRFGSRFESSSIRGYEPYRGFEPWYFEDKQGFQCFAIVDRSIQSVDGAGCVPPGVDLFADIDAWSDLGSAYLEGFPDGSIIRFHYRGDSVDVFVYPASGAD